MHVSLVVIHSLSKFAYGLSRITPDLLPYLWVNIEDFTRQRRELIFEKWGFWFLMFFFLMLIFFDSLWFFVLKFIHQYWGLQLLRSFLFEKGYLGSHLYF